MKYVNKEIIKESNKCYLIVDIICYLIISIFGIIILSLKGMESINTLRYLYLIYYVVGTFSFISYVINRRKGDCEFLYFSLINIYVGSYVLIYIKYMPVHFIIGSSLLIYTILNAFNKGIHAYLCDYENKVEAVSKLSIMITLMILSIFTSVYFYKNDTIDYEIVGYYFAIFGLLSMIEPLLSIVLKNKKISKLLIGSIESKEVKKIKTMPKRELKKPINKEKSSVKK